MQPLTASTLAPLAAAPPELWRAWTFDPLIVCGLVVATLAYGRGLGVLWAHGTARALPVVRVVAFAGGMLALAVALLSPLGTLDDELFAIHMAQHMLLILVAAPLLVLGSPGLAVVAGLSPRSRRRLTRWRRSPAGRAAARVIDQPLLVLLAHVAVVWTWHLPVPYQAALASPSLHALEHASFLGTAVLLWRTVVGRDRRRRLARGLAILYLFVTALQAGALGALLTFASRPLYPRQALGSSAWGLTPLADQQLAGIVMWVPGGVVYLAAAAALLLLWLAEMEAEARSVQPPPEGHAGQDSLVGLDAVTPIVGRGERP
ncbi:MAG TPA: cytochrome c oxidase assembly protein [Actinomycetota bacterium]|jgi:cytochrome c oxidase assembly factor CtaG|nr:cytochrome c oxidase assembly protein [Actinomycetota bacterium]